MKNGGECLENGGDGSLRETYKLETFLELEETSSIWRIGGGSARIVREISVRRMMIEMKVMPFFVVGSGDEVVENVEVPLSRSSSRHSCLFQIIFQTLQPD